MARPLGHSAFERLIAQTLDPARMDEREWSERRHLRLVRPELMAALGQARAPRGGRLAAADRLDPQAVGRSAPAGGSAAANLLEIAKRHTGRVFFLSAPLTSGVREIGFMQRHAVKRGDAGGNAYVREVIVPNAADAALMRDRLHQVFPEHVVVSPDALSMPGWSQGDYHAFWLTFIAMSAARVVLSPGWVFSRGSRLEARLCLHEGYATCTADLEPLAATDAHAADEWASEALSHAGWSDREVALYLPALA